MLIVFRFEEILPMCAKQGSFGRMVGLIVRPRGWPGKIGEKGVRGRGAFSLGHFLRACLLIMYFCWLFAQICHGGNEEQ